MEVKNKGEHVFLGREITDGIVCLGPKAIQIIKCLQMLKNNTVLIKIIKRKTKCDLFSY